MPTPPVLNEMHGPRRNLGTPALVAVLLLALLAAAFHDRNPLTARAASYASHVMHASGGAYVTLRALNAALSTAQEVEVSGSVVVASGSGQPLRWLEPIDDTVERMAGIVFALMLASGLIALAIGPIGAIGAGMMAVGTVFLLLERLVDRRDTLAPLTRRLMWYGGFLLVALPLAFVLSSGLAEVLTGHALARNQAVIDEIVSGVGQVENSGDLAEGLIERLRYAMNEASKYTELANQMWSRADDLIRAFIGVMSVYVFRILILPALMVTGLFLACRALARKA